LQEQGYSTHLIGTLSHLATASAGAGVFLVLTDDIVTKEPAITLVKENKIQFYKQSITPHT
jgi:hypothetical protein